MLPSIVSRPPTGDKSENGTATFPTGSEAGWLFLSSHGKPSTCPGPPQTVHVSHPPPPRAQATGYQRLGFFLLYLPWYTLGRGQISCQNAKTRPKFRKALADLVLWPTSSPPPHSGLRNLPESSAAGPQVLVHEVLSARTPAPLFSLGSASSLSREAPYRPCSQALPKEQSTGGSPDPGSLSRGSGAGLGQ